MGRVSRILRGLGGLDAPSPARFSFDRAPCGLVPGQCSLVLLDRGSDPPSRLTIAQVRKVRLGLFAEDKCLPAPARVRARIARASDGMAENESGLRLRRCCRSARSKVSCGMDFGGQCCQGELPISLPLAPLRPAILCQPNIPLPLHGVNPRSILGQGWWRKAKADAVSRMGGRCEACGSGPEKESHKGRPWLEGHEIYKTSYSSGRLVFHGVTPLCHYCHNFVHSGRLGCIAGNEKTWAEVREILEHGFRVISTANSIRRAKAPMKVFPGSIDLARHENVRARTFGAVPYVIPESMVKWEDWRMEILGNAYDPVHGSRNDWAMAYGGPA